MNALMNRMAWPKPLLTAALGLVVTGALLPLRVAVVRGGSMFPTLHTGQVIAVDRGFYRHQALSVGDVVLFRGEHGVYVKRVHAVAGQTVRLLTSADGDISLPLTPSAARKLAHTGHLSGAMVRRVPVPEGTFFALGDALHNSEDSRDFGPVPVERILGRVLPIGASLAAPDSPPGPSAVSHLASAHL